MKIAFSGSKFNNRFDDVGENVLADISNKRKYGASTKSNFDEPSAKRQNIAKIFEDTNDNKENATKEFDLITR